MSTDNPNPTSRYWLCPLYSFNCDCDVVNLEDGIQIKQAFRELQDYIYRQTHSLYGRWDDPSAFDWIASLPNCERAEGVSAPDELLRIGLAENDRASDLLVDVITALRLYHGGGITPGPLISASSSNFEWGVGGTTIWSPLSKSDFLHSGHKYVLHQTDVPKVNELLVGIRRWREAGILNKLDITLKRFHSDYHGPIEDRIIDQIIAFESLYLGNEQELTYKLTSRVAFLLRKRRDHRIMVFNNMKKAYNCRSRIVHGDNPPSRDELRAIVLKTEEYLRQSIRKFLLLLSKRHSMKRLRQGTKEELAELDENILRNGELIG